MEEASSPFMIGAVATEDDEQCDALTVSSCATSVTTKEFLGSEFPDRLHPIDCIAVLVRKCVAFPSVTLYVETNK